MASAGRHVCPGCGEVLDSTRLISATLCPKCLRKVNIEGAGRGKYAYGTRPAENPRHTPGANPFRYRLSHYIHALVILAVVPAVLYIAMPRVLAAQTGDHLAYLEGLAAMEPDFDNLASTMPGIDVSSAKRDLERLLSVADRGEGFTGMVGLASGLLAGLCLAAAYLNAVNTDRSKRRANLASLLVILALAAVNVSAVRHGRAEAVGAYQASAGQLNAILGRLTLAALETPNVQLARKLIDYSRSLDAGDARGATALHLTAEHGLTGIAHEIIDEELQVVDVRDARSATPLMYAVRSRKLAVARMFVKAGADPAAHDVDGVTPLHLAAENDDVAMVAFLLDAGAPLSARDEAGNTPTDTAFLNENDAALAALLDAGSGAAQANTHLLTEAVEAVVDRVVRAQVALDVKAVKELHRVTMLLHRDIDPNTAGPAGNTPLHLIRNALDQLAEDSPNVPVLARLAKQLIDAGADPARRNAGGARAYGLTVAARFDDVDGVKRLASEAPSGLDEPGLYGKTALQIAIEHEHTRCARALFEAGATTRNWTDSKYGPLEAAVQRGNPDLAALVLRHCKAPSDEARPSATALHIAAELGHANLIDLLIGNGYRVDSQDIHGNTPLHLASRNGHRKCAERLLAHGADPTTWNSEGLTPLVIADAAGHEALHKLLKQHVLNGSGS